MEATCLHPRTLALWITSVLSNSFKSNTFSACFYKQYGEQVLHLAALGTSKQVLIFSSNPLHPSNIHYIPSLHSVLQALHSGFASFDTKEWLIFSRGISTSRRPSGQRRSFLNVFCLSLHRLLMKEVPELELPGQLESRWQLHSQTSCARVASVCGWGFADGKSIEGTDLSCCDSERYWKKCYRVLKL